MTDTNTVQPSEESNPFDAIKQELQEQMATMKESFEQSLNEKDDQIKQLLEQNQQLQRALVRSAMTDPVPAPQPKSEEDIYKEQIQALAGKTLKYMESM